MMQKRLRILLAEGTPSETAQTLGALFSGPAGGLELTVVSTLATLIPTINLVEYGLRSTLPARPTLTP